MPLWLLALVVAIGLIAVIGAVHLTGGSRRVPLDGRAAFVAAFAAAGYDMSDPNNDISWCVAGEDAMVGLAQLRNGTVGVVKAGARKAKLKSLDVGDVAFVDVSRDGFTLTFRMVDRTWRPVSLVMDDPAKVLYARDLLRPLMAETA